jgi:hypothetical protein
LIKIFFWLDKYSYMTCFWDHFYLDFCIRKISYKILASFRRFFFTPNNASFAIKLFRNTISPKMFRNIEINYNIFCMF